MYVCICKYLHTYIYAYLLRKVFWLMFIFCIQICYRERELCLKDYFGTSILFHPCMYACVHSCMHVYIHVCMCTCMYACIRPWFSFILVFTKTTNKSRGHMHTCKAFILRTNLLLVKRTWVYAMQLVIIRMFEANFDESIMYFHAKKIWINFKEW